MANYEIFDLLYSEFRDKFDDDNVVFNQKCVVGKQRIRIHFLHEEKILRNYKKLQEKFAYVSGWTPFYFNCFSAGNNIVVYQFISKNKNEIRVFGYFCSLAIF